MEDMKEECQKYGSVVSLLIPRENPGKGQVGAFVPVVLPFRAELTLRQSRRYRNLSIQ